MTKPIDIEAYHVAEEIIAQAHESARQMAGPNIERRKIIREALQFLHTDPVAIEWAEHRRILSIADGKDFADGAASIRYQIIDGLVCDVANVCIALGISVSTIRASIGMAEAAGGASS